MPWLHYGLCPWDVNQNSSLLSCMASLWAFGYSNRKINQDRLQDFCVCVCDLMLFSLGNTSLASFFDKCNCNRHLESIAQKCWFLTGPQMPCGPLNQGKLCHFYLHFFLFVFIPLIRPLFDSAHRHDNHSAPNWSYPACLVSFQGWWHRQALGVLQQPGWDLDKVTSLHSLF